MANLYFGPYNDPGDTQLRHHWDANHDPDCHNASFIVDRTGQRLDIRLAIRNRGSNASPGDLVVTAYAAACGLFAAVPDVTALVRRVLLNGSPNPSDNEDQVSTYLRRWSVASGNVAVVPAYNPALDTPWISESVPWMIPAYSSSFVLVATLSSASGGLLPTSAYTQDPCVAVCLG